MEAALFEMFKNQVVPDKHDVLKTSISEMCAKYDMENEAQPIKLDLGEDKYYIIVMRSGRYEGENIFVESNGTWRFVS
jgi:hypothetical protein